MKTQADKLAKALEFLLNKADFDCGMGVLDRDTRNLSYTDMTRKAIRKAEKALKEYEQSKLYNYPAKVKDDPCNCQGFGHVTECANWVMCF